MNLGEMETALKRYGFDSADPLKTWLNAAMHEIETDHDWVFLEGEVSIFNSTANGANLSIPSGTSKIISVRDLSNDRKLTYYGWWRFFREIEDPKEKGLPTIYTVEQGKAFLVLWPIPTAKWEFEVISQLETKDMAVVGDTPKTNAADWPTPMHWPIVLKAAVTALFAENEEERGEKLQKQYDKLLENLRRRFSQVTMDEPETVVDIQGYGPEVPEGMV